TVHKSQGMSLDVAEMDLSKAFDYGMGYVALSRLRSLEGLRLLGINEMAFRVNDEIGEMDMVFKKLSKEVAAELGQIGTEELKLRHSTFLKGIISKESGIKSADTLKVLYNKFFGKK
ncbi:MAG: hypothetical protein UV55_C0033G0001, partial [Candidatus Gottesmanbacteria bacterium GW2011_GWC1_43_10]